MTIITKDHQLTMWLCTKAMDLFSLSSVASTVSGASQAGDTDNVSPEEADVAHYIGGFVCCKLKQRNCTDDYVTVIEALVSSSEPSHQTLLAAKSRGRLTNLTEDGKCVFLSVEESFRHLFPPSVIKMDKNHFIEECVNNRVVQNCFHSATDV